ncbi:MAG: glycosyltransferase family 4 protein [Thiocapsa sp.]|uniref:glycosyltransferase family 4 protein n=1 Tax=Thiocapsa sp. TaxID=2024551 RepID=UPI001BCECD3E|nr:glycosyltransferase family 1 protein [Thiocapsa sp.]QVL50103.1 MAG: glycosyltransferase family 4 protein [Thiocapsa sp.]
MTLVYDISVLGMGQYHKTARTGIFRVIESLGEALVRRRAIDRLSAGSDLTSYFRCKDYLRENSVLQTVELIEPSVNRLVREILDRYLSERIPASSTSLGASFRTRIGNRIKRELRAVDALNLPAWDDVGVYHSTFYPVPEPIVNLKHVKKVITVYDLIPIKFPEFCRAGAIDIVKKQMASIEPDTWVTVISESTKVDLCSYHDIDPAHVVVTPLAAAAHFSQCTDADRIELIKKDLKIPEGRYVLSLSTLEPRKNIATTIRCFAKVIEELGQTDVSLVLVGTQGWDFQDVLQEIDNSPRLRERIIVTGFVSDELLSPLYSGASVFLYPSFYEGFGLPPLEAMQCGVPVITSNTSSLPEVVGDAGIMLAPNDEEGICQAMVELLSSDDRRQELSDRSLRQAKKFSWDRTADLTMDVYARAMRE